MEFVGIRTKSRSLDDFAEITEFMYIEMHLSLSLAVIASYDNSTCLIGLPRPFSCFAIRSQISRVYVPKLANHDCCDGSSGEGKLVSAYPSLTHQNCSCALIDLDVKARSLE